MFYNDHDPPHFHARWAGRVAWFEIESGAIIHGGLPPGRTRLVTRWAERHRRELRENWRRLREHLPSVPIPPEE
jgi:hypothetical protein